MAKHRALYGVGRYLLFSLQHPKPAQPHARGGYFLFVSRTMMPGLPGEKNNTFLVILTMPKKLFPPKKRISLPFALLMVLKQTYLLKRCLVFLKIKKVTNFLIFGLEKNNKFDGFNFYKAELAILKKIIRRTRRNLAILARLQTRQVEDMMDREVY